MILSYMIIGAGSRARSEMSAEEIAGGLNTLTMRRQITGGLRFQITRNIAGGIRMTGMRRQITGHSRESEIRHLMTAIRMGLAIIWNIAGEIRTPGMRR